MSKKFNDYFMKVYLHIDCSKEMSFILVLLEFNNVIHFKKIQPITANPSSI